MMAVHDVADRLARDELARLRNDGDRALLVEWRFHDDDVVLHLDDDAVMRTARQVPHSVSHLLRGDPRVGVGVLAHGVRSLDVDRGIGTHVAHQEVERRVTGGRLADPSRELDASEVTIVPVVDHDGDVADDRVRHQPLDPRDQVVLADGRLQAEAAGNAERDRPALHGGVARHRGLHDPVRGGPQLELPIGQRDGRRHRLLTHDVPREIAAHLQIQPLLAADGLHAAGAGRVQRLRPHLFVAQRGRVVIHRPRVALDVVLRPR